MSNGKLSQARRAHNGLVDNQNVWALLKCGLEAFEYDLESRRGTLRLPETHCTDMTGAIRFFKHIDPGVRRIETWSGDDPDTTYRLVDGVWMALEPRPTLRAVS